MSDSKFWKQKLRAFLHDPPSKALEDKKHQIDHQAILEIRKPFQLFMKFSCCFEIRIVFYIWILP